jgi:hypothetical protein
MRGSMKRVDWLIDWLIDWLFIDLCPVQEYFTYMPRRHHYCEGLQNLGLCSCSAQGLWAERDLYRATLAVTRDVGFSGLIRRTAPFSRLLRHTRGCGESILTWILTGPLSVAFYDTQEDVEDLFSYPDPRGNEEGWKSAQLIVQAVQITCMHLRSFSTNHHLASAVFLLDKMTKIPNSDLFETQVGITIKSRQLRTL